MHIRASAIVCAARTQGETGVVARLLTADHGLVAGYVAGGRGRRLRPVLIPGNLVAADLAARAGGELAFLKLELTRSRAPWLAEPLPAAAIAWVTALAAAALPERHPYPALHAALAALLDAICFAPSARGWTRALVAFETLVLRELGYGAPPRSDDRVDGDWPALLARFDRIGAALARHPLADRTLAVRGRDAMGARTLLRDRLARIG